MGVDSWQVGRARVPWNSQGFARAAEIVPIISPAGDRPGGPVHPSPSVPLPSPVPTLDILVVEDHDGLRETTVLALQGMGHRALGAAGGRELDAALEGFRPDLLLLDLNLPGEDGLSIARRMRAARPGLGIILVTVREQVQDRVEGYGSGADLYLTKPTSLEELTAAIAALARRLRPVPQDLQEGAPPEASPRMKARAAHDFLLGLEGKPPTLEDLARRLGLAPRSLAEAFVQEYGCTVHAFVSGLRLERARQAILGTDLPLKAIAAHLGYSHVNNFIAMFTRKFGHPPGSLRRSRDQD